MADIAKALAHVQKAAEELEAVRKHLDSRIVCDILLQMEQRLRLDVAHLGTLVGLKVVGQRPKPKPKPKVSRAPSKPPKRKRQ